MSKSSTAPIVLGDGPDAALLLHGFTGSPFELAPLAEELARRGHRVHVPLLAGHGSDVRTLGATGASDWRRSARDALAGLVGEGHQQVRVAGLSLGGLLAILLSAEEPSRVSALALLAPALDFHGPSRFYRDFFRLPFTARLIREVPKGGSNLRDAEMLARKPPFPRAPTSCAVQVHALQQEARAALPRVRAPALVLCGAHDRVVPRRAAEYAAERIGSGPAKLVVFAHSAHQLALDVERERVVREVARFFALSARKGS